MKDFTYQVRVRVTIEPRPIENRSTLKSVDVLLEVPMEVGWKDGHELPNQAGMKAQTQGLIQGINSSIQYAHQNGMWDSAEHLRYVIEELERAFVYAGAQAQEGMWDE